MNFCMYELSKNQHIQKKVHEELDELLKSRDINDLTYDAIASMKYLDWCIDETRKFFFDFHLITHPRSDFASFIQPSP